MGRRTRPRGGHYRTGVLRVGYRCLKCGSWRGIQRPSGQMRSKSHLKTMFCATCGKPRTFLQIT